MTGVHGVGSPDEALEQGVFEEWLPETPSSQYTTADLAVATTRRRSRQPVAAGTESVRCWLVGEVYGRE